MAVFRRSVGALIACGYLVRKWGGGTLAYGEPRLLGGGAHPIRGRSGCHPAPGYPIAVFFL